MPDLQSTFVTVAPSIDLVAGKIDQTGHLAAAILAGDPVDVFISANRRYMEQVRDAGLVGDFYVFARNALCMFVRKERVGDINNLADIGRSDVRTMVAPAESDPGGAYTVELIERAELTGIFEEQKQRGNIMVAGTGRPMPELIASGEVDAIILYRSLAGRFPDFEVVLLPPELDMSDRNVFTVGAIVRDGRKHPMADAFTVMLFSPAGQELLERNGFLPA